MLIHVGVAVKHTSWSFTFVLGVQPALRFSFKEDLHSEEITGLKQFLLVYDHQIQMLNILFKNAGTETSLNPGGQQGICFPVLLTGKMR